MERLTIAVWWGRDFYKNSVKKISEVHLFEQIKHVKTPSSSFVNSIHIFDRNGMFWIQLISLIFYYHEQTWRLYHMNGK